MLVCNVCAHSVHMYAPQSWQYTTDNCTEHIIHCMFIGCLQHSIKEVNNPSRSFAQDSAAFSSLLSWVLFLLLCDDDDDAFGSKSWLKYKSSTSSVNLSFPWSAMLSVGIRESAVLLWTSGTESRVILNRSPWLAPREYIRFSLTVSAFVSFVCETSRSVQCGCWVSWIWSPPWVPGMRHQH